MSGVQSTIVQRRYVFEGGGNALFNLAKLGLAVADKARIVAGVKQLHQQRRHVGVAHQGLLHIGEAEGDRRLTQESAHRS